MDMRYQMKRNAIDKDARDCKRGKYFSNIELLVRLPATVGGGAGGKEEEPIKVSLFFNGYK